MNSKTYHLMKENMCAEKNVELLYVWESDWTQKQEHIIKILKNFFKTKNTRRFKETRNRGE